MHLLVAHSATQYISSFVYKCATICQLLALFIIYQNNTRKQMTLILKSFKYL